MNGEKKKISLITYLLSLVIMALAIICIISNLAKIVITEKYNTEGQKTESQVQKLN